MGDLLRQFTYPRDAIAGSPSQSADRAFYLIATVRRGALNDKATQNHFTDSKAFLGIVDGDTASPVVREIGELYAQRYAADPISAWRWLLTTAMWLYAFPNRSGAHTNRVARALGIKVNFFDLILRTLHHLSAVPGGEALYFEELLPVLDDDHHWDWNPLGVAPAILMARGGSGAVTTQYSRPLLADLEDQYGVKRDNLAATFKKNFAQTGLFSLVSNAQDQPIGIQLSTETQVDGIYRDRYKHALAHPMFTEATP